MEINGDSNTNQEYVNIDSVNDNKEIFDTVLNNENFLNNNINLNKESSEQDVMSSITDENEEEIKSLENNIEENRNNVKNENIFDSVNVSDEGNLELYLKNNDLTMLEDYVNRHFSNLSQEEMVNKLMSLDENFREKLLNLVMEYQQKISNEGEVNNVKTSLGGDMVNQENIMNQSGVQDTNQMINVSNIDQTNYGKILKLII